MSETIKKIRKDCLSNGFVPVALLLLCLISYAPLIRQLGFYWDDWPSIFYLHFLGPAGFLKAFAVDRPLLGWVFYFTSQLAGESILKWQLFGILTRWLSSVMLWWMLRLLWQEKTKQAAWIALLFAIYPGFSQQYISVTYSNAFLVFSIFLASYVAMLLALRKKAWYLPLYFISLCFSAFSLFTSEYFFGLELIRPIIIFFFIRNSKPKKRLLQTILYWLPYLIVIGWFLFWRLYLTDTPRGEIQIFNFLKSNPLYASLYFIFTVTKDLIQVALLAWKRVFFLEKLTKYGNYSIWCYIAITTLTGLLAMIYLYLLELGNKRKPNDNQEINWAKQALLLGGLAMLFAGLPFWVAYLPIKLQFPQDRFTMPLMVGACIFLVGLVELIIRRKLLIAFFLSILIGASAGFHYYNALIYAREWNFQKTFFWQLSWRIPAITPGALLLTPELPFNYYSDNSLTAPLNWIYAPENKTQELPYTIFDLDARLYKTLNNFERDIPIQGDYRAMNFSGSTSQVLGYFFKPPRCVTVIDPNIEQLIPNGDLYLPEALALSETKWIQPGHSPPISLPIQYYGEKPAPTWCYYFEKADLARQFGNWDEIAYLGEQAKSYPSKLTPENAIELTTFVEGYVRTGRWTNALLWSQSAFEKNDKTQTRLCSIWQEVYDKELESSVPPEIIQHIENELLCK